MSLTLTTIQRVLTWDLQVRNVTNQAQYSIVTNFLTIEMTWLMFKTKAKPRGTACIVASPLPVNTRVGVLSLSPLNDSNAYSLWLSGDVVASGTAHGMQVNGELPHPTDLCTPFTSLAMPLTESTTFWMNDEPGASFFAHLPKAWKCILVFTYYSVKAYQPTVLCNKMNSALSRWDV